MVVEIFRLKFTLTLVGVLIVVGQTFAQKAPDRIALTFTNQTKESVQFFVDGASRCAVAAQATCDLDIIPGLHAYIVRTNSGDLAKTVDIKEGSLCLFLRESGFTADKCTVSQPGIRQKITTFFLNLTGEKAKLFIDSEQKCDLYNSESPAECVVDLLPGEHVYVARTSGGHEYSQKFVVVEKGPGPRILIQRPLSSLVTDLQKSPSDPSLRERAIKLALAEKTPLEIPEAARRHFIKGNAIQKDAKAPADFALAISEYRQALLLAPWYGDAYYNLGLALTAGGEFDDAVANIKFYLLTKPSEADARAAQDRIYEIEAKRDLAARQKQREADQAALAAQAKAEETRKKSLTGFWVAYSTFAKRWETRQEGGYDIVESNGSVSVTYYSGPTRYTYQPYNIQFTPGFLSFDFRYGPPGYYNHVEIRLSGDGEYAEFTNKNYDPGRPTETYVGRLKRLN